MTLSKSARLGSWCLCFGLSILTTIDNATAQAPIVNVGAIGATSIVDKFAATAAVMPPLPAPVVNIADYVDDQSSVEFAQSLTAPAQQPVAAPAIAGDAAATSSASLLGIEANLRSAVGTSVAESILFLEKDIGAALRRNVPGISTEPRAPLISDPILRGRRLGQTNAKGSYWFPARLDLDTALSKIDPRLIQDIIVIKGPYSALYGPSFSFYDVKLFDAPRYEFLDPGDFQHNGMTVLEYETNGEQWHGRQAVWGGTTDWGYRVGYSHRTGSDYKTGAGNKLPSSYKSRELDVALGANLTTNSTIDFHYLRLDQTDLEIPGQYFDINGLATNGYAVTFGLEDQPRYDRLEIEGWYNDTQFDGDNLRPGKRSILPGLMGFQNRIEGDTDVSAHSTGYHLAFEWSDPNSGTLIAGTDFRYLGQQLRESNDIIFGPVGSQSTFSQDFFIPKSHSSNPGVFIEFDAPLTDGWKVRSGGRVDWVSMNADRMVNGTNIADLLRADLDQHFALGAAFANLERKLCQHIFSLGAGYAMRPPTITEMYAGLPLIAVIPQNVFTNVLGDPLLDPEKMLQVDVALNTELGGWRSGLSGFYAWVEDYITFDFADVDYEYLNTPLATLSGFEFYSEYDIHRSLTLFGTASYTEGRDHSRLSTISRERQAVDPGSQRSDATSKEEPLPVIAPLESRMGVRLHSTESRWLVEFAANITDAQDRVATSLAEEVTPGYTTFDVTGYARLKDDLLLTAGVLNLTDKFYRSHFDTRRFGRTQVNNLFRPGITFYFGTEMTY